MEKLPMDKAEGIWKDVLAIVADRVPPQSFKTWLEPTKGTSIKGNILVVDVPNPFFIDWIEEHYHDILMRAISDVTGEELSIKFNPQERGIKPKVEKTRLYHVDACNLQGRYRFDSFVVGSGNRFAHAASLAVAKSPGQMYNPLFVYGAVGLGKTHLLQAIGNYVKEELSSLKVYYTSCEKFLNEMVDAIQNGTTVQFKKRYRNKDVLLIDDMQFIENKEGLQEEIFHTFNSLHDKEKQVVLSSDRPPIEIKGIEERLLSRFQWGLICDLKPLDLETRLAILKKRVEISGKSIPNEILLYIAQRIKLNVRELEGALVTLLALSSLTDTQLTIETSKEIIDGIIGKKRSIGMTIDKIQEAVSNYYSITPQALRGKRRTKTVVFPRQVAIYISREYTNLPLNLIGKAFGGKDHSTILYTHEKIKNLLEKDVNMRNEVNQIIERAKK